ncbi:MAG TPA: multiheme c-type cytochrome [Myxococcota bacterium]|jgi:hypothetical protein|nr:multiheme c-type cytochrome [Myxococcota bacterium]
MSKAFSYSAPVAALLLALVVALAPRAAPAERADYVGSETCGTCHRAEYDKWRTSAHARATATLPGTFRRDPRCAGCHATDTLGELAEVGCESCHGAGRWYYKAAVMRDAEVARALGLTDAGEATCKGCHGSDAPSVRPFDFKEAWKRIAHGPKK